MIAVNITIATRMHSSGMRTARLLTVSKHALHGGLPGDVCAWGCLPGGVCPWGVCWGVSASGLGGCIPACNGADPPCGQADTCEDITFANFVYGQ